MGLFHYNFFNRDIRMSGNLHVVSLVRQSSETDSKPAAWQVKLFFQTVNDPCTEMFEHRRPKLTFRESEELIIYLFI